MYSQKVESQPFQYKNNVQVELFGHGFFYSINYERFLLNNKRFMTAAQVGIAYYPESTGMIKLWVPIVVNELYSMGNHHIELGGGVVFNDEKWEYEQLGEPKTEYTFFYTGRLGYRYQNPESHFLVRIGFTPFLEDFSWSGFHPSGGVAVGYAF